MLVLDNSLLTDYLDGQSAAEAFLDDWEDEAWAVPSLVAFETYMGALHGYLDADVPTVRSGIQSAMEVLEMRETTAAEAVRLQESLRERGIMAEQHDAFIAASATENGAAFATADQFFWQDAVADVVEIAEYRPER